MFEITHGGAWFKWSALDAIDKRLAAVSLIASVPPGVVVGLIAGGYAYQGGYRLGSGGKAAPRSHFEELTAELTAPWVMLAALAFALVSAIAWWRFSLRQDELFNRIQNYALGQSCCWSVAAVSVWWFLERAGIVPALPLGLLLLLVMVLLYVFWFRAVRMWA
jgi:hypothetical protein